MSHRMIIVCDLCGGECQRLGTAYAGNPAHGSQQPVDFCAACLEREAASVRPLFGDPDRLADLEAVQFAWNNLLTEDETDLLRGRIPPRREPVL